MSMSNDEGTNGGPPTAKRMRWSSNGGGYRNDDDDHDDRGPASSSQQQDRVDDRMSLSPFSLPTNHTPTCRVVEQVLLMDELLTHVFKFVGPQQFLFLAGTNRRFYSIHQRAFPAIQMTRCNVTTLAHAQICLNVGGIPNRYLLPLWNLALENNRLDMLYHLRYVYKLDPPIHRSFQDAAELGYLHMFQWLTSISRVPYNERVCSLAAKNGHIPILRYIYDMTIPSTLPWKTHTCYSSASNGQWETLKWLMDHGCPVCDRTMRLIEQHRYNMYLDIIWNRARGNE